MSEEQPVKARTTLRRSAIVAVLVLLTSGASYGAYRLITGLDSGPKKHVMEVVTLKLIQPPPPPPPPPPPVVKPPEPAKMLEQPKEAPPDKPKAAAPPQPLALDAKAGPGSDPFGLGGRPGGEALIGGGGGGGSRFGWYANIIQSQIQQALQKDDKLRNSHYRIVVSVWLSSSGRPDQVKLVSTTGDRDIDSRIQVTLAAMPSLPEAPPRDMPQPVNVRIGAQ
jgi:protein TonB